MDQRGFTLIEVLVAMVILAVGLLGLEALGIGAARSIAAADRRSELAVGAAAAQERTQQQLRRNPAAVATGSSCTTDAPARITICTDVQTRATLGSLPPRTARVVVRASRTGIHTDTLTASSYVFDPRLP